MKNIIIIFILAFLYYNGNCQNVGIIEYNYRTYGNYQNKMLLLIKNGKSKFIFHKDPKIINVDGDIKAYHYFEHFESYYDFATRKMVENRTLKDNTVLIADWLSDLKWEITDETQEILGYTVRKAIAPSYELDVKSDSSHDYAIAWFTTEIPIPSGPDRYVGLPGLVLKLEFESGVAEEYICTRIDFNKNPDFSTPTKGIKVKLEEIMRPHIINKKWLKKQKELQ